MSDNSAADPRPLRIFLCHSSADKPAVRELYHRLKADGFEPWLDEEDLLLGQDWQLEIPKAVRQSDIVIVCLSKASINAAGYLQKEIKFALDVADEQPAGAIFIIPLRLEACDVPDRLQRWHWGNLFDPNGYTKLLRVLQFRAKSLPATIATQSEELVAPRPQDGETSQSNSAVSNQSGGVDLKANDVAVGQDVTGRDKVVSAGGHIIHAEHGATVNINERSTGLPAEQLASNARDAERAEQSLTSAPQKTKWLLLTLALGVIAVIALIAVLTSGPTATLAPTQAPEFPTNTPIPTPTAQPTVTPTLGIGSTPVATDGMTLLYIPAGEFKMGAADSDTQAATDERPQHTVYLDAFWIDQTEVTNAMFKKFIDATSYQTDAEKQGSGSVFDLTKKQWSDTKGADWQHPRGTSSNLNGLDNHPVVQVSWNDATAYCQWAGGNLPTEAQWEKATRWDDAKKQPRIYPWGDQAVAGNLLNFADRNLDIDWADKSIDDGYQFTAPVGHYPDGASFYGALGMAGNVWEWVRDWYNEKYYASSPAQNPGGPSSGTYRVLRGGSWLNKASDVRVSNRFGSYPVDRLDFNVGFRCAR